VDAPRFDAPLEHRRFVELAQALDRVMTDVRAGRRLVQPLLGPTQVGKTLLARGTGAIEVETPTYPLSPVEALYVEMPTRPTSKTLPLAILRSLGLSRVATKLASASADMLTELCLRQLGNARTRLMVIDELQHAVEPGSHIKPRHISDLLKYFYNHLDLSMLLVGLPKGHVIFDQNEQLADRANNTLYFLPYRWTIDADREAFAAAVASFLEVLHEHGFALVADYAETVRCLYAESGGRVGHVARVMSQVAEHAEPEHGGLTRASFGLVCQRLFNRRYGERSAFELDELPDQKLVQSYNRVLKDADVPLLQPHLLDVAAELDD
jgi:hypothetical protein